SNTGLVLDLHRAHRGVELLHEVVLLVVEGRSSEARDAERAACAVTVLVLPLPELLAGPDDPLRDHVHRAVEVEVLPVGAVRPPVADLGHPGGRGDELLAGAALGAQPTAGDR